MIPENLKYSKEHEWIKEDGTMGVTDYAQSELGDVVFVEVPKTGKEVKKGAELAVLESVKAVSNVYSPVAGTVVEANQKLSDKPELVNQSPYENGWIAKIKISDTAELKSLMSSTDYKKYIDELHPKH